MSQPRKTYRPWCPEQSYLLPPSPREWLPAGHLSYFLLDVVGQLDLAAIRAPYERELRGMPPHDPQMMVTLLLYGYCVGVPSSRRIERKTYEDVGLRVIAGGTHPDHSTISEFRRVHLPALSALVVQVLQLCQQAGLVKLGQVAIDGTKLKANASKHKAMSYDRMTKNEEELAAKVAELLAAAERVDADEDVRYGKNRHGDELPEQLQRAQTRLARIRELKASLEAEAKAQRESKVAAAAAAAATEAAAAAPAPGRRAPATRSVATAWWSAPSVARRAQRTGCKPMHVGCTPTPGQVRRSGQGAAQK